MNPEPKTPVGTTRATTPMEQIPRNTNPRNTKRCER